MSLISSYYYSGNVVPVIVSGRNGSIPCHGETVTYVCTVRATAHTWKIPSLSFSETISRLDPIFPSPGGPASQFSINTTADGEFITTALTMVADSSFNGTNITCLDNNARPGEGEVQQISVEVFGKLQRL